MGTLRPEAVTGPTETPAPPVPRADRWHGVPHPVLVADSSAAVREVNGPASLLLPRARVGAPLSQTAPTWLTAAHRRMTARTAGPSEPVCGTIEGRTVEAHPVRESDGSVVWWLVDDTDRRLARAALESERERTAFLTRASTLLLSSLNADRCTETTARLATEHLADAALVVTPMTARRLPLTFCRHGEPPTRSLVRADPSTVPGLAEALQGFPPVPSRWIDPQALPDWVVPAELGPVGSVAVVPLPGHGVPAGALVLLRHRGGSAFDDGEEVLARLFAARAGAALSAARLYAQQSGITETLMRELLPPPLHHVHGVELAAAYTPAGAGERVGGDFYDLHPAPDDSRESLVVLGDVCGKGLEAAVLTGKIRSTLHALLPLADDHGRVLHLLNSALLTSHHTRFATLVLASARRHGHDVRVRLTSAGHLAPLVLRADGTVRAADTRGTLVGVLPDPVFGTTEVTLGPGEICLLFTDGITEARGGPLGDEMFGEHRLRRTMTACAGMPVEAVVEHVRMRTADWVGAGRHDDMAVVAVGAPRGTHLSAVDGHGRGRYTG